MTSDAEPPVSLPRPATDRVVRGFLGVLIGALWTRRGRSAVVITLLVTGLAFFGPLTPGTDPLAFVAKPYAPPGPTSGLLGADALGRDVVSRVLHGGWVLLLMATLATALAVSCGALAGVSAAYLRGRYDGLIMRSVDVLLSLPSLVFVLVALSIVGPAPPLVVCIVGVIQAPQVARVMYAASLDVCERDFVKAVAILGVPAHAVIRRQVMPMLMTPLMVETGLRLSYSIVMIAGLSFLGLGTPPPRPDWGVMVNENRLGMASNVWGVAAPAIVIALLAIGTNTFTDAIARASRGEDSAKGESGSAPGPMPTAHDPAVPLP